jgi:uncharacterized protein
MSWTAAANAHLEQLLSFLLPREWACVAVTAALHAAGRAEIPSDGGKRLYVDADREGTIRGALLYNAGGIFYPVLERDSGVPATPPPAGLKAKELRKALGATFRRVYSVVGRERDVAAFESAVSAVPRQSVRYYLMVQETAPVMEPDPRVPPRLRIRQATPADAGALFDIQRGYEMEEVLLDGNTFNAEASMRHLQLTLATQRVSIAEIGGRAIAKAGTNARGIRYEQIGGVYTSPEYRNRGIGTTLMRTLMEEIEQAGKQCTLFVKRHNAPAISMYSKLGFAVRDDFRITYYR